MEKRSNESLEEEVRNFAEHHLKPRFGITPEKLLEEKTKFVEQLQTRSDKELDPDKRTKIFNDALDLLNDLTKDVNYPSKEDDYDNGL
jgi:hypothetical protein